MKGVSAMDNQYNYYNPDPQNMDDQDIFHHEPGQEPGGKKNRPSRKKWLGVISMGLVFGLVACAAFQAGNIGKYGRRQLRREHN